MNLSEKKLDSSLRPHGDREIMHLSQVTGSDWELQIQRLKVEIAEHSNKPTRDSRAFMRNAVAWLQALPDAWDPLERAEVLRDIARWFYLDACFEDSLRAGASAINCAKSGGHVLVEFRARLTCASALRQSSRYAEALTEITSAIDLSRQIARPDCEAKAINSLGNLYVDLGMQEDALKLFERIAAQFEASGDRFSMQMALDNAAIAALRLGRVEQGLQFAERAAEIWIGKVESADDRLWSVQGSMPYCQLLIRAGRFEEARACAQLARVVGNKSGLLQAELLAEVAVAVSDYCCEIDRGEGIERVLARALAEFPMLFDYTLEAAIRAFEQKGQIDKALALQRELVAFSQAQRTDQVKAVLGGYSPEQSAEDSRLVVLSQEVERKRSHLDRIAIDQSLRSGFDHARVFRLGKLAELFAGTEGLTGVELTSTALSARLLDIGMMVIPDDLLTKPRPLTDSELSIVEKHAEFGAEILMNARLALLQPCAPIVRFHHERWDGSGPYGLIGEAIPIEARIVSLCDAFDALCQVRPWRDAYPVPTALHMIADRAGTQFDPQLTLRFVEWTREQLRTNLDFVEQLEAEALENDYVILRKKIDRLVHCDP